MPFRTSIYGGMVLPLRRRRVVRGRGIFGSIGNFLKGAVSRVVPAVWNSGLVGNLASRVNPGLGSLVKAVGGRRRVVRRKRPVGSRLIGSRRRPTRVGAGLLSALLGMARRRLPTRRVGMRRRRVVRRRLL